MKLSQIAIIALAVLAFAAPAHANVAIVAGSAGQISDYVQLAMGEFGGGISLIVTTIGLSGTYKVEVSNDPPVSIPQLMNVHPASKAPGVTMWVQHDELVGKSGSSASNLGFPVQWVRLNCTGVTAGSATLSVGCERH